MGMEAVMARALDSQMYAAGYSTTVEHTTRKWKDRPAIVAGDTVEILKLTWTDTGYGQMSPRVLVRTSAGTERWISASTLKPHNQGVVTGLDEAVAAKYESLAAE